MPLLLSKIRIEDFEILIVEELEDIKNKDNSSTSSNKIASIIASFKLINLAKKLRLDNRART